MNRRRPIYYDMNDHSLKGDDSVKIWSLQYKSDKSRVVGQQHTWLGFYVSTVWLGIDHNYLDKGPPLIYETMVFFKSWTDLDCERYSTREEAKVGHEIMVKKWSNPFYVMNYFIKEIKFEFKCWIGRKLRKRGSY